jgi:hypothetical protein
LDNESKRAAQQRMNIIVMARRQLSDLLCQSLRQPTWWSVSQPLISSFPSVTLSVSSSWDLADMVQIPKPAILHFSQSSFFLRTQARAIFGQLTVGGISSQTLVPSMSSRWTLGCCREELEPKYLASRPNGEQGERCYTNCARRLSSPSLPAPTQFLRRSI